MRVTKYGTAFTNWYIHVAQKLLYFRHVQKNCVSILMYFSHKRFLFLPSSSPYCQVTHMSRQRQALRHTHTHTQPACAWLSPTVRTSARIWIQPLCSFFSRFPTERSFCEAPGSAAQLPAYRPLHVQSESLLSASLIPLFTTLQIYSFNPSQWHASSIHSQKRTWWLGVTLNTSPNLSSASNWKLLSPPSAVNWNLYFLHDALDVKNTLYSANQMFFIFLALYFPALKYLLF